MSLASICGAGLKRQPLAIEVVSTQSIEIRALDLKKKNDKNTKKKTK